MKAIYLDAPGSFRLAEVSEPKKPTTGEVLVRVLRVGICGTDLHAFQGNQAFIKFPLILGHELAVEVLEVDPSVSGLNPGDICTVMPYLSCEQIDLYGHTCCETNCVPLYFLYQPKG